MISDARLNKMTSGIIDAIEAARAQRGMSIRALSKESGVSLQYLYSVMRKERQPSIDILFKIIQPLGLSIQLRDSVADGE